MNTAAIELQDVEYTGRISLATWRKVFAFARPYPKQVFGLCFMAIGLACLESLFPLVMRGAINEAAKRGLSAHLWPYALAYAIFIVLFGSNVTIFIRLAGWISSTVSHDLRKKSFAHLQDLSFSFYDRRPAGWLVARLTGDCDRLSNIIAWGTLVDLVWSGCVVIGTIILLLSLNWHLGLWVATIIPALLVVSLIFQPRILRLSRSIRKQNSFITGLYNECIAGVRTTKTLVREQQNLGEFQAKTDHMYRDSVRNSMLTAMYLPLVLTIGSIGQALALWRGGVSALHTNPASPDVGTMVAIISSAGTLIWPIWEMSRVLADMQNAQAAAERVLGLIDTEPAVKDTPQVLSAMSAVRGRGGPLASEAIDGGEKEIRHVEFSHVNFHYVEGQKVLADFNLIVNAGQTIALVGPTGGGKSTIVNLLGRFYEPTGGEILINGKEYRQRSLMWLQSSLGIVLQQPHLFSGTIRQNIRYGRLDATDEEIETAAKLVCAHDFIMKQDGGYETEVGEAGVKLSTGQKQLVAFARAVLADPQIFIMDEATSSVDTQTEQLIQQGLAAVLKGRISFIIAHRLSTIRRADRILVIEGGKIIETGTHRELIAKRGNYYELYTNQFTEERTSEVLAAHCPAASIAART